MLVLCRKKNQSIIITTATGENIKIIITETMKNKSHIGIEASRSIQVDREEIYQRKLRGIKR